MSEITIKSADQKVAEAEVESFRKNLGPFVVAAETTRMAMVFADATEPNNPIIFANDSFLALTGSEREEVLGKSFNFLLAHAADVEALARIKNAFEGTHESGAEVLYRRKDGSEFWTRQFGTPSASDQALAVSADDSGGYVAGTTPQALPGQASGGAFVRKYDFAGSDVWTQQFGAGSDEDQSR